MLPVAGNCSQPITISGMPRVKVTQLGNPIVSFLPSDDCSEPRLLARLASDRYVVSPPRLCCNHYGDQRVHTGMSLPIFPSLGMVESVRPMHVKCSQCEQSASVFDTISHGVFFMPTFAVSTLLLYRACSLILDGVTLSRQVEMLKEEVQQQVIPAL